MFIQLCMFVLCLAAIVAFGAAIIAYGLGFIAGAECLAALVGTGYCTARAAAHIE